MFLAAALTLAMTTSQLPDNARMDWWREAKFGMFIHWGLYAVPAGEWNGATNHAEWIRETAHIPIQEYETLLKQFNPVKFDPDAWAKMAKDAGMKYIVITSKHHDGFNLFDSPYTDWDVMSTPYKKDIMKMLSEACARQGIRFCTYHSIMDWHHPDYMPKRSWEGSGWRASQVDQVGDNYTPDFNRFEKYLHDEVRHIVKSYHPAVMWFDGQWESTWNTDLGKTLLEVCRRADPNMVVNNRVNSGPQGGGDYLTPEQEIPADAVQGKDWETCMTMNGNWGYNKADKNFKSTKDMIRMLADITSKGGNYLMNIGPMANGEFPPESVQRLKEIGAWMRVNGDSIYGTTASPFGKLPWGRCTVKKRGANSTLYFHVFDWPKDATLTVPGLGNDVRKAALLSGGTLNFKRNGSDVVVTLPKQSPNEIDAVIALDVKGDPLVYRTPVIEAEAKQFVSRITVKMDAPGLEVRYTTDGTDPGDKTYRTYKTYSRAFDLNETTVVKARAFHNGKAVTGLAESKFEKVKPWPAKAVTDQVPGLEVRLFEGTWDTLPEFFFQTNYKKIFLPTISIADDPKKEYCGRLFLGMIEVPDDEMYRFALNSDDGSRLWVDGQLVVDNNGLHGPVEKIGSIALAKGKHQIGLEWFNKTGGAVVGLRWGKLGAALSGVPASAFSRGAG